MPATPTTDARDPKLPVRAHVRALSLQLLMTLMYARRSG